MSHIKYFSHLDGLRAIAALLVILFHAGSLLEDKGVVSLLTRSFGNGARYGVDLFFCLSGFLITYLLIREISLHKSISIKNFYIRRLLRIWPLYFAVGIGGVVVLPLIQDSFKHFVDFQGKQYLINIFFLFTFSVNFQLIFGLFNQAVMGSLWSVSVEEQFYLIWAPFIELFKNKLKLFVWVIFFIGLILNIYLNQHYYYNTFARILNFGCGALIAVYFESITKRKFYSSIPFTIFSILFAIIMNSGKLINFFHLGTYINIFDSISTVLLIMLFVQEQPCISLNNKVLLYLGKISYGMYLFHTFCGLIAYTLLSHFLVPENFLFSFVYIFIVILLTIIISSLSFFLFESFFLKYKIKYQ